MATNTKANRLARALMRQTPGLLYTEALAQVRRNANGAIMEAKKPAVPQDSILWMALARARAEAEAARGDREKALAMWPELVEAVKPVLAVLAEVPVTNGSVYGRRRIIPGVAMLGGSDLMLNVGVGGPISISGDIDNPETWGVPIPDHCTSDFVTGLIEVLRALCAPSSPGSPRLAAYRPSTLPERFVNLGARVPTGVMEAYEQNTSGPSDLDVLMGVLDPPGAAIQPGECAKVAIDDGIGLVQVEPPGATVTLTGIDAVSVDGTTSTQVFSGRMDAGLLGLNQEVRIKFSRVPRDGKLHLTFRNDSDVPVTVHVQVVPRRFSKFVAADLS